MYFLLSWLLFFQCVIYSIKFEKAAHFLYRFLSKYRSTWNDPVNKGFFLLAEKFSTEGNGKENAVNIF